MLSKEDKEKFFDDLIEYYKYLYRLNMKVRIRKDKEIEDMIVKYYQTDNPEDLEKIRKVFADAKAR
jgi:uncharacterized lipoprotein YehR (DUF1307 family)